MLANGLSAPQHSTYLVIFDEGRDRVGGPPGVAIYLLIEPNKLNATKMFVSIFTYRYHQANEYEHHLHWKRTFFAYLKRC